MLFTADRRKKLTPKQFDQEVERLIAWVRSSVSPFPSDTPEQQRERVRRAREDQDFFDETYLPHYFTEPSAEFHPEMEALIDDGERQQRPVAVAAPRGFSKSTRVSFARVLKRALYQEKRFIPVISDTETQAKGITVSIRVECEHNPRITHDFGPQKTGEWAAGEFVLATGTKILARGDGQGIRGVKHGPHRPDLIVIDDIESDESVRNPQRVKQTEQWINEAVIPSLDPKRGVLFMVGTLLSKRSVLARMLGNPEWISKVYRALQEDGTSLWPERFPVERLLRIKALIGSVAFAKEYQNEPSDEDALFRQEWIRRYKADDLPAIAGVWLFIDPSISTGESADFRAIPVVAKGVDARLYCRHADITRRSLDSLIKTAYLLQARFGAVGVGLETNGFQKVLKTLFDRAAKAEGRYLPILEVNHAIAKEARISRLSPLCEQGVLVFEDGPDVGQMELLIEQLLAYPSSTVHDDGPDALEGAVGLAEGALGDFSYATTGIRRDSAQLDRAWIGEPDRHALAGF
jgi:predicted phage terminase large subunit-like protein